jgi:hypothetical protein
MPSICDPKHALWLLCALLGCSGELAGEVDGLKFVRCAQTRPTQRTYSVGAIRLAVEERTLRVDGTTRIAAFTGPVGRAFSPADVALLEASELALWIGGLGDTLELAQKNLALLAARRVPTVFLAGGADRWPIVEKAFEALPADVPIVQGSGLRTLQVGDRRFLIAAGAPEGRYAIDEQGCGLTPGDVAEIEEASGPGGSLLLSWHAPNGESGRLASTWRAIGEPHGLSAFPEPSGPDDVWVVPRLGPPGTQRGDGARLRSRVGHWELGAQGLRPVSRP